MYSKAEKIVTRVIFQSSEINQPLSIVILSFMKFLAAIEIGKKTQKKKDAIEHHLPSNLPQRMQVS